MSLHFTLKSLIHRLSLALGERLKAWLHPFQRRARSRRLAGELRQRLATIRAAGKRGPIVAISRTDYLGDIVACEPIVRWVKARHPSAYILGCVREPYREVIDSHPEIDETLVVRCISEWLDLWKSGLFDEVIDLHPEGKICTLCGEPLVKESVTVSAQYHGALLPVSCGHASIEVIDEQPRLHIPPEVRRSVDRLELPERYVAFHCRSNRAVRWWLPERWGRLAELIRAAYGLPVVEIGLAPTVPAGQGVTHLCGDLRVLESAEVLRRATFFVGVDSGPAHMANALEVPAVLLFAKRTQFERFVPYTGGYATGATADLIHCEGNLLELSAEAVFAVVEQRLSPRAAGL